MLTRVLTQILKEVFIFAIYCYQVCSASLFISSCRFSPTCSQYTMDAIRQQGPFRGVYLGMIRILRCQPFSAGGHDPVKKGVRS